MLRSINEHTSMFFLIFIHFIAVYQFNFMPMFVTDNHDESSKFRLQQDIIQILVPKCNYVTHWQPIASFIWCIRNCERSLLGISRTFLTWYCVTQ